MTEASRVGLAAEPVADYEPGRVASLTRTALLAGGLGRKDRRTPLADIVPEGARVLLKPNWVYHRNLAGAGLDCLFTNPEVVLAVLSETLAARPSRVVIGDAPIQTCAFERIVTPELRERVSEMSRLSGIPVAIEDFRRTICPDESLSSVLALDQRPMERFCLFDLGADSLLEPIARPGNRFRVGDYDPRELAKAHAAGRHRYLVARELFEADVVISLPKLKTHIKTGMTGALKNAVGINGTKDFLPHYRHGGSRAGGDSYAGSSRPMQAAEALQDRANEVIGTQKYRAWLALARAFRLWAPRARRQWGGAWSGNDTCWRMVLDLNRILLYGRADGTMAGTPERTVFSITDAIVCGQGNGPLHPRPFPVGAVTFARSAVAADVVHCALLGFDAQRLPLVREACSAFRWPLASGPVAPEVHTTKGRVSLEQVASLWGRKAEAPTGWVGAIEMTGGKEAR